MSVADCQEWASVSQRSVALEDFSLFRDVLRISCSTRRTVADHSQVSASSLPQSLTLTPSQGGSSTILLMWSHSISCIPVDQSQGQLQHLGTERLPLARVRRCARVPYRIQSQDAVTEEFLFGC